MKARYWFSLCLFIPANSITAAKADDKADALLKEAASTYKAAQTLSGTLTQQMGNPKHVVVTRLKVELKRPYLAHVVVLSEQETKSGKTKAADVAGDLTVADGTNVWEYDKATNSYTKHVFHLPEGLMRLSNMTNLIPIFYRPESLAQWQFLPQMMQAFGGKPALTKRYVGRKTIDGVNYDVIEAILKTYVGNQPEPFVNTFEFYIGPDKFLHRMISTVQMPKAYRSSAGSLKSAEVLTDVQVNKPIPDSEFTFMPPAGAVLNSKK